MKSSGKCPKCSSADIHAVVLDVQRIGSTIATANFFGWTKVDHYVCGQCGYVETYVSDGEALAEIARKWPRVTPD